MDNAGRVANRCSAPEPALVTKTMDSDSYTG
jgi:hypothetical protein